MEYAQQQIRIDKELSDKMRMWAKKKAVENGTFSLNAYLVGLVNDAMTKEGVI